MLIRLLFFFCILTQTISLNAQSPYETSWKVDAPIFGLSTSFVLGSKLISDRTPNHTEDDINILDPQTIFGLDRKTSTRWSVKAQKQSDFLLRSSFVIPTLLLAGSRPRGDVGMVGLLYLETLLFTSTLTGFTKSAVRRTRPFVYNSNSDIPFDLKISRDARRSFFSGHTSVTAAMSFMTAKMYSDYYPDSDLKPFIWGTAIMIPAATGFLRTRAGKHFNTDVITGFAVGALIGFFIPQLHRK